MLISIN